MTLLDVVLPRRCAVCGRVGASLCGTCLPRLVRCAPPWCDRCGAPGAWPVRRCAECAGRRLAFSSARGALVYDAGARAFVASWKERGRRDLAAVAAGVVAAGVPRPDVDAITFVPGDRDRQLRRGHAPARALAAELAVAWSIPFFAPVAPPAGDRPAAGPAEGRAPRKRRRGVLPEVAVAAACLPRRRRLHDGIDGDGVRHGAPPRRGSHGRSRLFCAGGAVVG